MRIVTSTSLRELAAGLRSKAPNDDHVFSALATVFEQCAQELESRDAQIEGLRRAIEALSTRLGGR